MTKIAILNAIYILAVLALCRSSLGQCAQSNAPMDPSVIGKSLSASAGCSVGEQMFSGELRIEKWGVFFQPIHSTFFQGGPVCREEIVSVYVKSDMMAMIYHRPPTFPTFFEKSHPEKYQRYLNGDRSALPCTAVPIQKILVWGGKRDLFISLIGKMIEGTKMIRDYDCALSYASNSGSPISRQLLASTLAQHQIGNAAINYLYNIAYSNFFCI